MGKGLLNTKIESKKLSLKLNKSFIISPKKYETDAYNNINDYSK